MLGGKGILVCDDEPFIALDLGIRVEEAGGMLIGPAASITEAMLLLDNHTVHGAILDVHLVDGEVTPVAARLLKCSVSVVVHTGVGLPPALQQRVPPISVFIKPTQPKLLIDALARLLR